MPIAIIDSARRGDDGIERAQTRLRLRVLSRPMNASLILIGIGKVVFGFVIGAAGIFSALRVLGRMMKWGDADAEIRRGNMAAAILVDSAQIAFGIVVQHAAGA